MENCTNKCSFCGEDIRNGVRRCPYCGSLLENTAACAYNYSHENSDTADGEETVQDLDSVYPSASVDEVPIEAGVEVEPEEPVSDVDFVLVEKAKLQSHAKPKTGQQLDETLGNKLKVMITALCAIIPGLGQLIGIITGIVFINSDSRDKSSFGSALLIASLLIFVLNLIVFFILAVALYGY